MLENIKLVLGIGDDSPDAVLTLMILDCTQAVLDYCHIHVLPTALESLVREMVVQQFSLQNEGNISSIKRGDTQISYHTPIGAESFTDRQKNRLNYYRKWRAK